MEVSQQHRGNSGSDLDTSFIPAAAGRILGGRLGFVAAAIGSLSLLTGCDGPSREEAAQKLGAEATQQVDKVLADATFIADQAKIKDPNSSMSKEDALRLSLLGHQTGRTYSQFSADLKLISDRTGFHSSEAITMLSLAYTCPEVPSVEAIAESVKEIRDLVPSCACSNSDLITLVEAKHKSGKSAEEVVNHYWLILRSGPYTSDFSAKATLSYLAP